MSIATVIAGCVAVGLALQPVLISRSNLEALSRQPETAAGIYGTQQQRSPDFIFPMEAGFSIWGPGR